MKFMVKSMTDFYKIPKKIKCEASNLKLKGNENYYLKCSYLELFWSAFFLIRTEYRGIFMVKFMVKLMVKSTIDSCEIPRKIKCEASNLKLKGNENHCV